MLPQAQVATLPKADNKTGYFGVYLTHPGKPKPYQARVRRVGNQVSLGMFATAEEAALCVARSPEGQEAAKRAAAAVAAAAPLTSEEVRLQAQAEGLTLTKADNMTGYFGVHHMPGRPKPYLAKVSRGGNQVRLGSFATTEEAALCVARSPEGQGAAKRAAAPPPAPPLTSEEARQQALAEGLTLLKADNKTGYFGVHYKHGRPKPYLAQVKRGGKDVHLGTFATAEEAALCVARSLEGREAAKRAAAPPPAPPLTSEEARQQAQAEGLTLLKADNKTGYFGVYLNKPSHPKPYEAQVKRGGNTVHLGSFATAEEAALCIARTPEGREAAQRAAASEGQGRAPAMPTGPVLKEEGAVPPMPPDAYVKEEEVAPPMPPGAFFKEEGTVPSKPSDADVKHVVVVEEEERADGGEKRQRTK
jgi:hypothetical protein